MGGNSSIYGLGQASIQLIGGCFLTCQMFYLYMSLYGREASVSRNISETLIHCKSVSSAKINRHFPDISFACRVNLSLA